MLRNITELYQYRALLWSLTQRELKVRYRASVLGFLWTFLNPTLQMLTYGLVFNVLLRQQQLHIERLGLAAGTYGVEPTIESAGGHAYDASAQACSFQVDSGGADRGIINLPHHWVAEVAHGGPGVLALIFYGAWIYLKVFRGVTSWRTTFAWGMLVFGILFAIVTFINRRLSAGRQMHIMQTILLHDLTAISLAEGTNLLPNWVRHDGSVPTLDELRRIYHPGDLVSLFGGNPAINLDQTTNPTELATLRQAWFVSVFKHPGAYVRHRINVLKPLLGIGATCYAYETDISANPFGIQMRPNEANQIAMKLLSIFRTTLIFRPWCYLAATGLMFLTFLRLSSVTRIPALALGGSAILYELPYFFIGPTCDFRYSWLVVLTALVMGVLLARALLPEPREAEPSPPLNHCEGA